MQNFNGKYSMDREEEWVFLFFPTVKISKTILIIELIIIECSKQAQKKYESRHDWVGKVIHWELCKKLNFDHTTKWYMHKQESVKEKETQRIFWNFEIRTDQLIPTRRPGQVIVNKKKKKRKVAV